MFTISKLNRSDELQAVDSVVSEGSPNARNGSPGEQITHNSKTKPLIAILPNLFFRDLPVLPSIANTHTHTHTHEQTTVCLSGSIHLGIIIQ